MSASESTHDDCLESVDVAERRHEVWIRGLLVEPDGCTLYSDFFVDGRTDAPAVTG